MSNAFVRMNNFEHHAAMYCYALAMATATNDPNVKGNYRECAYSVRKLANWLGQCIRANVCQSFFQIAFSFVYLHIFSLDVPVNTCVPPYVLLQFLFYFASILLWQ